MELELLNPARYAEASRVLVAAFESDPIYQFMFVESPHRHQRMAWLFERWFRCIAPFGSSYIFEDGKGVAIWVPPDCSPLIGWLRQLQVGLAYAPIKLGFRSFRNVLYAEEDMKSRWKRDKTCPHWTLEVIGIDPAHQREGRGRILIDQVLRKADATQVPCFLVTHNPANPPYYQRYGFRVVYEAAVPGGGPPGWTLVRDVPG